MIGPLARFALVALCVVLAACAGPTSRPPAPVEERLPTQETEVGPDLETLRGPAEVTPSTQQLALAEDPSPAIAPSNAAVQTLLAAAMQAATRDDWDRAQAALERAIKMAPGDSNLWTQLAYTHLRQGEFDQAGELAQRALSLSSVQRSDKAAVWRLIADVESARGNANEAADARRKAVRLTE